MDVVHVKWANCPTGDHNHANGKEGYPTLAFQCLTDFNCRVLAIVLSEGFGLTCGILTQEESRK